MRCYPFWFFAALLLAGCSFSVTDSPLPTHGGQLDGKTTNVVLSTHPLAPVPAVEHHDTIDLSTVVQSATTIPQHIEDLERTVIVCGILLAVVGVANAVLLVRLLSSRMRIPSAVPLPSAVAVPMPNAVVAHVPDVVPVPEAVAFCACGASISARTKTGRCRACAVEQRVKKRATERSARQQPSTQPQHSTG